MSSNKFRQADRIYDELLVIRCRAGEAKAFELLVARWQPRLLRVALVICRDRQLAEDLVQDSWITAVRKLGTLRDPASFGFWLIRIVNNRCMDALKSRNTEPQAPPAAEPAHMPGEVENGEAITEVLKLLDTRHRAVLALHYLQDLEVNEIAMVLDIPPGTVKSRLHHAREAFRKKFTELTAYVSREA
ncbi:MAG: sigma-70 family RNA polymerase sigma factor [Pseudomonadales bacterium]|nr:sigma-70 family RNA polymerase sigma factor [Pseudomonadales bacterium]